MPVFCDLHTHSCFSDGSFTPTQLAVEAARKGIRYWALTDHDTTDGCEEAERAAGENHLIFIPGIEISVEDYHDRPFHLLGLGINRTSRQLHELCARQTKRRKERFLEICSRLSKNNALMIDGESVLQNQKGAPGRLAIAREMIRRGNVKSIEEAFVRYLGSSSGNAVSYQKPSLEEALEAIHDDDGIAFAAHPLSLNLNWEQTEKFLREINAAGVDGVEVIHSGSTLTRQRYLQAIAARLGMQMSGGSDFHGEGKPHAVLGRMSNGKPIALTWLPTLLREKYCQETANKI